QGSIPSVILQKITRQDLFGIPFYYFEAGTLARFNDVTLPATGYSGVDGFDLYFNNNAVNPEAIWVAILEAGEEFDIQACGLGAWDTLRLELGFARYGNYITKDTHQLEARMGGLTKLDKCEFIGRDAILDVQEEGLKCKVVWL